MDQQSVGKQETIHLKSRWALSGCILRCVLRPPPRRTLMLPLVPQMMASLFMSASADVPTKAVRLPGYLRTTAVASSQPVSLTCPTARTSSGMRGPNTISTSCSTYTPKSRMVPPPCAFVLHRKTHREFLHPRRPGRRTHAALLFFRRT